MAIEVSPAEMQRHARHILLINQNISAENYYLTFGDLGSFPADLADKNVIIGVMDSLKGCCSADDKAKVQALIQVFGRVPECEAENWHHQILSEIDTHLRNCSPLEIMDIWPDISEAGWQLDYAAAKVLRSQADQITDDNIPAVQEFIKKVRYSAYTDVPSLLVALLSGAKLTAAKARKALAELFEHKATTRPEVQQAQYPPSSRFDFCTYIYRNLFNHHDLNLGDILRFYHITDKKDVATRAEICRNLGRPNCISDLMAIAKV